MMWPARAPRRPLVKPLWTALGWASGVALLLSRGAEAEVGGGGGGPPGQAPIAIFHGLGCNSSILDFEAQILTEMTGRPAASLEYAPFSQMIVESLEAQAESACKALQQHPWFKDAPEFDIVGHSNGGIIARWIIQKCETRGRVRSFISVGSPQHGVIDIPPQYLPGEWTQSSIEWLVSEAYWWPSIQSRIGPAGYVYNPREWETFRKANTFLGRLNNEGYEVDSLQKERLERLDRILLVKFGGDTVVRPVESEWLGAYVLRHGGADGSAHEAGAPTTPVPHQNHSGNATGEGGGEAGAQDLHWPADNSDLELLPFNETDLYKNDTVGFRHLDDERRLFFYLSPATHDHLTDEERRTVLVPFLQGRTIEDVRERFSTRPYGAGQDPPRTRGGPAGARRALPGPPRPEPAADEAPLAGAAAAAPLPAPSTSGPAPAGATEVMVLV